MRKLEREKIPQKVVLEKELSQAVGELSKSVQQIQDAVQHVVVAHHRGAFRVVGGLQAVVVLRRLLHGVGEHLLHQRILAVIVVIERDAAGFPPAAELRNGDLLEGHLRQQQGPCR